MRRGIELILGGILLGFLAASCAPLPKIVVLHDPLSAGEHASLGAAYEKRGEYDPALSEYRAALKKAETGEEKGKAYFMIGNVHYLKGEYERAEGFYEKSLRANPSFAAAYNNQAWNNLKLGKPDRARESAERAAALEPDNGEFQDTLRTLREIAP